MKKIRIAVSLIIFAFILLLYLDLSNTFIDPVSRVIQRLQFFPSLIRFSTFFFAVSGLGFILVILITLFFGRVYCSSLCPLGTLQGVIINLSRKFRSRKKRKFAYSKFSNRFLRYGILAVTLLFWVFGSLFFINLLDPYGNFGKISVTFFQPLFFLINNAANMILESFYIYSLNPLEIKTVPMYIVLVSTVIFLVVFIMAVLRGRLYCNTICPVGAALGVISETSVFRIGIHKGSCAQCMKCEVVCKAQCIDIKSKTIDQGRCVSCFNCFASCPNEGMYYKYRFKAADFSVKSANSRRPDDRRNFLKAFASAVLAVPVIGGGRLLAVSDSRAGAISTGTVYPVTPPGSLGYDHFTSKCIACYLCVSVCPTNVIIPSFFDYGLEGFMQPKLDYNKSFCNYDCIRCTEICPTGAITELSHKEKIVTQIGVAKFMPESCIVITDGTDCGACSEHCPTKAVQMVPYNGIFLPAVTPNLCIGCGACEYACPTEPYKAIFVESNPVHKKAKPVKDDNGPREYDEDEFPF